ncbi:MAG: hypothetical protein N838_04855 [Thiohalocapsa sp. PB-PSB1]|jgi:hypothetical protein|nr:MAG: hypothetical protein N838_04855 [Thiohalocapsa sp. PB-PSB1]
MFATNLILLLALIAMVGLAIWLFKDGEGVGPTPVSSIADAKKDGPAQADAQPQVRVVVNDFDSETSIDRKLDQSDHT